MTNESMANHMKTSLCVSALQMAFWRRKPAQGLLHHSDRGSQYASKEYREHLAIMGMEQSMSRKGNCWDNAPTERFFRSLKYEMSPVSLDHYIATRFDKLKPSFENNLALACAYLWLKL